MKDYEQKVIYARCQKTLTPWKAWAEENRLRAKRKKLGKGRQFKGFAYPFMLVIEDFNKVENENELLEKLNHDFFWENPSEGFAKGEVKQQEVVINVKKKGEWLPRQSKKRRYAY